MGDKVAIIAFPANDFGMQERKDDAHTDLCQVSGVTFPNNKKKGVVRKKTEQQPIYCWLTDKTQNGLE